MGATRDSLRLYEQAIRSASRNGFTHNEAIAYELAARFLESELFGHEKGAFTGAIAQKGGPLRTGRQGNSVSG